LQIVLRVPGWGYVASPGSAAKTARNKQPGSSSPGRSIAAKTSNRATCNNNNNNDIDNNISGG